MSIALLGPEGTFSHFVALSSCPERTPLFCESIGEVFDKLGEAGMAVVPLKNSVTGFLPETIERLQESACCVVGRQVVPIAHHLVGAEEAETLFCHPHTHKQCSEAVHRYCPHCEVVFTRSNAEAALRASSEKGMAFIPHFATKTYPLPVIASNVQDAEGDTTEFLLLAKECMGEGDDPHTLLLISHLSEEVTEEEVRSLFAKNALKLVRCTPIDELLLIEVAGSYREPLFEEALRDLSEMVRVKVLGAFTEDA